MLFFLSKLSSNSLYLYHTTSNYCVIYKWRNNKNLCFAACWPWYLSCRGSHSSLQWPESWWRDPWPTDNPSNCIVCCWSLCLYLCILWMLWSTAREPLHGLHSECYSYNYACKLIKQLLVLYSTRLFRLALT